MIEAAILTWPILAGQLVMFGTAAFRSILAPNRRGNDIGWDRSLLRLWRILAFVVLIVSPFVFMEMASAMASMTWSEVLPSVPEILRETHAGQIWVWRFVTEALLAIVAFIPMRQVLASLLLFAASAALLVMVSLSSHAIDKGNVAVAIYFLHLSAAGLWIGALVSLLLAAIHGRAASQWLESAIPRVSSICGWSVVALAITGLCNAYERLGFDLRLLTDSLYGRTLLWKLVIATPILMLGGYNRYRLVPAVSEASARQSLIRSVGVECLLLFAVFGWSALLANTPPPH